MKLWRASLSLIVTAVLSAVLLATGTAVGAAANAIPFYSRESGNL